MNNLLDLLTPEDRKKALDSYASRMRGSGEHKKAKVSPTAHLLAEVGVMYGWGAIEAAKRGYVDSESDDGTKIKIPLTMEELSMLADAGRKVVYSQAVNQARGTQVATASVLSKHPNETFERGMRPMLKEIKGVTGAKSVSSAPKNNK